MRRFILIVSIVLSVCLSQSSLAQLRTIILDVNNRAVNGAIVSVHSLVDTSHVLHHITSDKNGRVVINNLVFPFLLKIRSMNYKNYRSEILTINDIPETITLRSSSILIDEVLVQMNEGFASLNHDTIKYNIAQLNLQDQDNLKEILKRIPGFYVDDNYKIVHAGQEINKILVNGKEAFEYQNKIALENIESGMLDGLNVINDYRDPFEIKLDEGNPEKVIDLKLKDDFTNIVKGNIELLTGYQNKFKIKPFLFYFDKSMSIFSLNNFNNLFDKDWSSEDYAGSISAYNINSRYYSSSNRSTFYSKDLTLNNELSFLNSTTIKRNTDKYSLQAVLNYTNLSSLKYAENNVRYLGNPIYSKWNTDSLNANMISYMFNFRCKIFNSSILQILFSNYQDKLLNNAGFDAVYDQEGTSFLVNEQTSQKTKVYSNRVSLDSRLSDKLVWTNSWNWRNEKSFDWWSIKALEGLVENPNQYRDKDLLFQNGENSITSSLNYLIIKGISAKYTIQKYYLSNDINFSNVHLKRNRLSSYLDGNIKTKYVNVDLSLSYNYLNQHLSNERRKTAYATGIVSVDVFLDNFKKNKLRLLVDRSVFFAPNRSGIMTNVLGFDQVFLGKPEYLLDVFSNLHSKLSYIYEYPFKGQSFQLSLTYRGSSDAIINHIHPDNNLFWSYERVQGFKSFSGNVSYSHSLFRKIYPLKLDVSYNFSLDKFQQIKERNEIPILQKTHYISLGWNTFSEKQINFVFKYLGELREIEYPMEALSFQKNYSVLFGPRFDKNRIRVKSMLKYSFVTDRVRSNSFLDMDLSAGYTLSKRIELLLSGENILQNLHIKSSDQLAILDNQNGIEYFQSYRNLVGYSNIGVKYRF